MHLCTLLAFSLCPLHYPGVCGITTIGIGNAVATANRVINLDACGVFIDAAFINAGFAAACSERANRTKSQNKYFFHIQIK